MSISKKAKIGAIALGTALALSGCSSSSSSDQASITQLGIFTLDEFTPRPGTIGSTVAFAAFFDLSDDISPYLSGLAQPTSDRCVINGEQPSELAEAVTIIDERVAISAGDTLVLTSPLGTFATMDKRVDEEFIIYSTTDSLDNIPAELTIDIPGDAFPAFSNVAIPEDTDITDLSVSEEALTDTSSFTWTPSGTSNTILAMELVYGSTFISCEIVDDGSFTLPAEIVAQTGPLTNGFVEFAVQVSENLVQSGNAVMIVNREKEVVIQ